MLIVIYNHFSSHDILGGRHPLAVSEIRESIPANRMEVSMRMERDQFPKSWSPSPSGSTHQDHYEAHEVSLNGEEESGSEKL